MITTTELNKILKEINDSYARIVKRISELESRVDELKQEKSSPNRKKSVDKS